jgi:hypothetical protein
MNDVIKELFDIFDDVPDNEKAREIFNTLYTLILEGKVLAIKDGDDIIYRANIHCSREDIKRAMKLSEVEAKQEYLIKQIQAQFN